MNMINLYNLANTYFLTHQPEFMLGMIVVSFGGVFVWALVDSILVVRANKAEG